jgi:hypothetical protein
MAGGTTKVDVTGTTAANNLQAGFVGQRSTTGTVVLSLSASTATGNSVGVINSSATVESFGNNHIRNNGIDFDGEPLTPVTLN